MKTKFKSSIRAAYHSFGGAACVGAVLLIASSARAQNLFAAGYSYTTIYEITPGGTVSIFNNNLSGPQGLAFNSAGDLFVANYDWFSGNGGKINKITPSGTMSTFATLSGNAYVLAFDSAGNLFVSNPSFNAIVKIKTNGVTSTFATVSGNPGELAFNSAGDLFVICTLGNRITKITTNGVTSTFASGFYSPHGLVFDSAGNLFTVSSGQVIKVKPDGTQSLFTMVNDPMGLTIDSADNLFVSQRFDRSIIKIAPNKKQSTFASGLCQQVIGLAFQPAPPILGIISRTNGVPYVIGVSGVCGQKIVFQSSPDLQNWASLVTNTFTSARWNYTNNTPQNYNAQYYRALWLW